MNYTLNNIAKAVDYFFERLDDQKSILLFGEMGTGKTSLIKEILERLAIEGEVSSPSYSLVNEYHYLDNGKKSKIYHIDLYRLEDLDEALSIGIEDYIGGDHLCFIEWPQLIESLYPQNRLEIHLTLNHDLSRGMEIITTKA